MTIVQIASDLLDMNYPVHGTRDDGFECSYTLKGRYMVVDPNHPYDLVKKLNHEWLETALNAFR